MYSMTRVVVRDRRFDRRMIKSRYIMDIKIDYPSIPGDIPVSDKAMSHCDKTKSNIGYADFRGLSKQDIISIFSAVKRQGAHVNVDRMGNCAYYMLKGIKYKYFTHGLTRLW